MSRAKMVDGYLCRDEEPSGAIVFFWALSFPPVKRGITWCTSPDDKDPGKFGLQIYNTLEDYREDYDLEPPAPGEMFEVEFQL